MEGSKKLKSISSIFAAVLAFGLVAYVLWRPAQSVDEKMSQRNSPQSAGEPQDLEPEGSEVAPIEPRTTLLSARPRGDVGTSDKRKRAAIEVTIPHDVAMDDYKTDLWAEIQANPPDV